MPRIEAFVLDFDGVMANSVQAHTAARLEAFHQLGFSDVDPALHDEAHKHGSHPHEIIGWVLTQAGIVAVGTDVNRDEIVERVVAAAKNYGADRLAIATTASYDHEVLPYLRRHKIKTKIKTVVAREDTPSDAMKPDPFVYAEAVRKVGLPPGRVAAIEDSPAGIRSARDAGLYVFGLATTHSFEELADANQVIGSFQVLNQMIEG